MKLFDALDTQSALVLGWLVTYLVHSTLWLAGAWAIERAVRSAAWRARLWRGAVLGGFASTALVALLATSRVGWNLVPQAPIHGALQDAAAIRLDAGPDAAAEPGRLGAVANGSTSVDRRAPAPPAPGPLAHGPRVDDAYPWIVALWLAGAAWGLARHARQHRRLSRVLAGRRAGDPALTAELERVALASGSGRGTRLSVSRSLGSPIALARGEIVVPERALERLSPREREALLAHELAHLVRRDPWWLLGLSLIERALFVQPLNRLATNRSMQAAELACDDLAARWTGADVELARCLVEVASWSGPAPIGMARGLAAGLTERRSALLERVERLLAPRAPRRRQGLLVGAWLLGCLVALAAAGPRATGTGGAQGEEPPVVRARILPQRTAEAAEPEAPHDPRIDRALEVLKECPEAAIAFHVGVREDGVDAKPTVPEGHALELRGDGSIHCGAMQLCFPGSGDERLLRYHLSEIARSMKKAPHPRTPFALPDERLELLIDEAAPHALLQSTLQACGLRGVQIWKLALVPVANGERGRPLPLALPVDVGVSTGAIERAGPLTVAVRALGSRNPANERPRRLVYEARYAAPAARDGEQGPGPASDPAMVGDLVSLAAFLAREHARDPGLDVVIDASPGTLYAEVVAVLDVVLEAGFTDIAFVGHRR